MNPAPPAPAAAPARPINPDLTLWLLSIAHAVNHAQAVLLPLIYLRIIAEFGVTESQVAYLAAIGAFASGVVQLSFAKLTRIVSRRTLLGTGGILFGAGFAAQGLTQSFLPFAVVSAVSRIGGSPQHPVGNGLLAEQLPGVTSRLRDQRPHQRRQRRDRRRGPRRGRPDRDDRVALGRRRVRRAGGADRTGHPVVRARERRRSAPRRWRMAAFGMRSGRCSAIRIIAGSISRRCSAAAVADSASSTCSRCCT